MQMGLISLRSVTSGWIPRQEMRPGLSIRKNESLISDYPWHFNEKVHA